MDHDESLEMIGRLARIATNVGHSAGLKPAQWEVLRYLARANRFSRTPGALTAYLGATKGTVSQTVIALERTGLVTKATAEGDRRFVHISLTPQGRALLEWDEMLLLGQTLSEMDPVERQALETGLKSLLQARLTRGGGRPFGICRTCRYFDRDGGDGGSHFCRLLKVPLSDNDAGKICVEQAPA